MRIIGRSKLILCIIITCYKMFREAQTEQENAGNLVRRENNINKMELEAMGAKPQLIMFMTGPGGAGKKVQ